ncbi:hypothetical protein MARI151_80001 [Maribacter litoralis]|uniref:Uncharacterized protein n=1 Tax=Maribacter litoralis TaxID=2059726 RepID=A0A653Y7D3_9FLAO|nr:hypothetical protein MARI151_80001 [Maribacter litoralis]
MVRPDIGNYMMGGIHAQLTEVVQLSCLARLYAYPGIGVGRTVMGLVARILCSLVSGARSLILVLRPFFVPALYRGELIIVGGNTSLSFIRPVALALAVWHFFVHCAYSTYFFQMLFQIFFGHLQLQCVHARVRFHGRTVDRLGMTGDHPLLNTQGKDIGEYFLEYRLGKKLTGTAYGTVPGKFLVNVIAYEKKNIQAHRTMGDKLTVADDVLQVAHQTELEEDHGVNTFLTAFTVIAFGQLIEKIQVQNLF